MDLPSMLGVVLKIMLVSNVPTRPLSMNCGRPRIQLRVGREGAQLSALADRSCADATAEHR